MYHHLRSLFLKGRGHKRDIERSIEEARKAVKEVKNNAGVIHILASSLVKAMEEGVRPIEDDLVKEAKEKMEKAIELDPDYAKYHSTKGRLQALQENFEMAKENIRTAIDKEDREEKDYAVRLGEYQYHLSRIQLKENHREIERSLQKTIEDVEEARREAEETVKGNRIRAVQFLGFFAALLAAVIGSIQIAVSFSFPEAAKLILVLVGGLLLAFGGFSFILPGEENFWKGAAISALGLLIIIFTMLSTSL